MIIPTYCTPQKGNQYIRLLNFARITKLGDGNQSPAKDYNTVIEDLNSFSESLDPAIRPILPLIYRNTAQTGTPGRKMIEGKIPVRAKIHTLTAYSAHADQQMLVDWVRAMPEPPGKIRLVHGEDGARRALALALGLSAQSLSLEFQENGSGSK